MEFPALERKFNDAKNLDSRVAAEYAYALAMLCERAGDEAQAVRFGREALALLKLCPENTADECVQRNVMIEGVPIPDFFHEGVVRRNLAPLLDPPPPPLKKWC